VYVCIAGYKYQIQNPEERRVLRMESRGEVDVTTHAPPIAAHLRPALMDIYVPPLTLPALLLSPPPSPSLSSAYMLVYVRESCLPTVMRPVTDADLPTHLTDRFTREVADVERRQREAREKELYAQVRVYIHN
jgi:hypothetical protein